MPLLLFLLLLLQDDMAQAEGLLDDGMQAEAVELYRKMFATQQETLGLSSQTAAFAFAMALRLTNYVRCLFCNLQLKGTVVAHVCLYWAPKPREPHPTHVAFIPRVGASTMSVQAPQTRKRWKQDSAWR